MRTPFVRSATTPTAALFWSQFPLPAPASAPPAFFKACPLAPIPIDNAWTKTFIGILKAGILQNGCFQNAEDAQSRATSLLEPEKGARRLFVGVVNEKRGKKFFRSDVEIRQRLIR